MLRHLGRRRFCPVCRAHLRGFVQWHPDDVPEARCPICESLQRHRHLWLFLERETDLLARPGRLLHLAPEAGLGARLRTLPSISYLSGDLEPGAAMAVLDLEALDLPSASFDWIVCSHVLEHVSDDRQAMSELARVLRPGGTAIVQVPMHGGPTVEDPTATDPAERLRRFGQADHVRVYGPDVVTRLSDAGFVVDSVVFRDQIPAADRLRFGLRYPGMAVDFDAIDDVWRVNVCRRPAAG